jgi:hypothetical protein
MFYDIYLYTLCYYICCLLGACMRCTRLCSLNPGVTAGWGGRTGRRPEDERDVRRRRKRWFPHDVKRPRGRAIATARVGVGAGAG